MIMERMNFINKVKFAYNIFFHPDRIKDPMEVTVDRSVVQNLESRIKYFEGLVKIQQEEFKNLINERDLLWALVQEARGEVPVIPEDGLTVRVYNNDGNITWQAPLTVKKK